MRKLMLASSIMMTANAWAGPLEDCPAEAFLIQGNPSNLYAVDLSTGAYRSISTDTGAQSTLNAIGFSTHDNHFYGWDKAEQTLFRMGDDYRVEHLYLSSPLNGHYYVGDVSLQENAYYMYRKGRNELHGLWRIGLDPDSGDYLAVDRIVDGSSVYMNIYDFAFHPDSNEIYSVDSRGNLLKIDPATGSVQQLGNVGERGTFGAVYFDRDGMLYISRNKDGVIFQIDLTGASVAAVQFAQGPSSSSNDGARCAIAPVVPVDSQKIDFGDAPDSYGTSLANNGARHNVEDSAVYMGALVDGEAQSYLAPDSDDEFGVDDEDGIQVVSNLTAGSQAILSSTIKGSGFLNGWIDFNKNGRFDESEHILVDEYKAEGQHTHLVDIPLSAKGGETWARFRVSSLAGAQPTGGMPDGEVEDHKFAINAASITRQYYPSEAGYVTLAFEDLWPSRGDYDLNDFVTHYRTGISTVNGEVSSIHIGGQVLALGATFHNGFAVQIDNLLPGEVDVANIAFEINGETINRSPLESGHTSAVFVVADDLWDYVTPAEGCTFYRTEKNCGESPIQFTYSLEIPLIKPVSADLIKVSLYKPFIFATPGFNRNSIFDSPPGRDLEIHLKNNQPSLLADPALLGRADDRSLPNAEIYYQTENGLPWALEIGTEWQHPWEYIDLIQAYPNFVDYVQSEGQSSKDWYLPGNAVQSELYND